MKAGEGLKTEGRISKGAYDRMYFLLQVGGLITGELIGVEGGGCIGGNLQYPSHLPIKVIQNISGLLSFFCAV